MNVNICVAFYIGTHVWFDINTGLHYRYGRGLERGALAVVDLYPHDQGVQENEERDGAVELVRPGRRSDRIRFSLRDPYVSGAP